MEKNNFSDTRCDSNTGQVYYKEVFASTATLVKDRMKCRFSFFFFFLNTAVAVQAKSPVIP